jgi:hypothetical protein
MSKNELITHGKKKPAAVVAASEQLKQTSLSKQHDLTHTHTYTHIGNQPWECPHRNS